MNKKEHTCCFFGHRKIDFTDELINRLKDIIEDLIIDKKIDTFLFGSKSAFNELCLKIVTELKNKYSYIKRIYVRAEFPYIDEKYESYLMTKYDETYYPERLLNAGRAVYVERNYEMVDNSNYCVCYYDEAYKPSNRNSGTKIAYDYAVKKGVKMIVIDKASHILWLAVTLRVFCIIHKELECNCCQKVFRRGL